jgi:iron uptake system EfeUOB component EfeO/EfeM
VLAVLKALLLNKYVFWAVAGIAVAAGLYFGVSYAWNHYVAEPYRAEGRAEMLNELQPVIDAQTKRLEADKAAFKQIEVAFAAINANSERLKRLAAQAQKVKIVRQEVETVRVEFLEKLIPTGETECQRMDDVISKALREGAP